MSAKADAIRERRWRENGGARLTMRISRDADNALTFLAQEHGITRRQAVESLLLGGLESADPLARSERLSPDEVRYLRSMS